MDLSGLRRALLERWFDRNTCTCVPVCMFLCMHVPMCVCAPGGVSLCACVPVYVHMSALGGDGDRRELTSLPVESGPTKKTVVV